MKKIVDDNQDTVILGSSKKGVALFKLAERNPRSLPKIAEVE
jgi:hypothetical protein